MEKFECNACGIVKEKSSYAKCRLCKDGIIKICKTCKLQGKRSQKIENKTHTFNEQFRKSETKHFSLAGCGKEDYLLMYQLLEIIGYDTSKNIHQQFLDRHNAQLEKPMDYKKRKYDTDNFILPNGEINPQYKSQRNKKTPTD
jgi:hypothetical protein